MLLHFILIALLLLPATLFFAEAAVEGKYRIGVVLGPFEYTGQACEKSPINGHLADANYPLLGALLRNADKFDDWLVDEEAARQLVYLPALHKTLAGDVPPTEHETLAGDVPPPEHETLALGGGVDDQPLAKHQHLLLSIDANLLIYRMRKNAGKPDVKVEMERHDVERFYCDEFFHHLHMVNHWREGEEHSFSLPQQPHWAAASQHGSSSPNSSYFSPSPLPSRPSSAGSFSSSSSTSTPTYFSSEPAPHASVLELLVKKLFGDTSKGEKARVRIVLNLDEVSKLTLREGLYAEEVEESDLQSLEWLCELLKADHWLMGRAAAAKHFKTKPKPEWIEAYPLLLGDEYMEFDVESPVMVGISAISTTTTASRFYEKVNVVAKHSVKSLADTQRNQGINPHGVMLDFAHPSNVELVEEELAEAHNLYRK